jgi:FkbM family methyltransferase
VIWVALAYMLKELVGRLLRWVDGRFETELFWATVVSRRLAPQVASGNARIKVLLAGLAFGTRRVRRPITLMLDGPCGPLPFTVPDYAAYKALDDVFCRREYQFELAEPPKSILDLGGHVGGSVLFFRRKWPGAAITVVEANPRLVGLLRRNVGELGVTILHAAVASENGTVQFVDSDQSWAGRIGSGGHRVPAISLDRLLAEPVDVLKMDIEGAEFDVLPGCERLSSVKTVVGEIHAEPGTPASEGLLSQFMDFDVESEGDGVGHTLFKAFRR